jgi:hypothetical protein
MTCQPFLEHQNSGDGAEQVGAELRLDLDEPGDHSIESYSPETGVGGYVDVVEPAPFGAAAHSGQSLAIAGHWLDRRQLKDGKVTGQSFPASTESTPGQQWPSLQSDGSSLCPSIGAASQPVSVSHFLVGADSFTGVTSTPPQRACDYGRSQLPKGQRGPRQLSTKTGIRTRAP